MDDEHNYLIGSHGYCTQVMEHLIKGLKNSSTIPYYLLL